LHVIIFHLLLHKKFKIYQNNGIEAILLAKTISNLYYHSIKVMA
jgi:hypothetical protein